MTYDFDRTVDDIVKADYRTADVFKKYEINYCCAGLVALKAICSEKNIDLDLVKEDLDQATRDIRMPDSLPFNEWKLDFLIDYTNRFCTPEKGRIWESFCPYIKKTPVYH